MKSLRIILFIYAFQNVNCTTLVSLQIKEPPIAALQAVLQDRATKYLEKAAMSDYYTARQMLKSRLNAITPPVSGFLGLYNGYMQFSSHYGILNFPLRHAPAQKVAVLVTPKIEPIMEKRNTVMGIKVPDSVADYELFEFEKKSDKNEQLFWTVKPKKLGKKRTVTKETVILLTKPKNIYIQKGEFLSSNSKHIILPSSIFAVGINDNVRSILDTLDVFKFFEQIQFNTNESEGLVQKIMINS